jgi:multiple sugar transport system substrate-binding protein
MAKKSNMMMAVALMVALLSGCGGGSAEPPADKPAGQKESQPADRIDQLTNTNPITLKVWTGDNDNLWNDTKVEPVKKKFPNITLERVSLQKNGLDKLLSAGDPPDIVNGSKNHMIFQVLPAKMEFDLTPLIKKYNYDLNRYSPDLIQSVKGFSDQGKLFGLPNTKVVYGLIYNKQLFDKFAAPYPKDDMTWDQAIQLAKRMSRTEDGFQYKGLTIQYYNIIGSQLNMVVIDRSGKASMSKWLKPASVIKQIYDVPGNSGTIPGSIAKMMDPFYKGTMAMVVANPASMFGGAKEHPDLQWDFTTTPTFPEAPNTDPYMNYTFLGISPTSQHKDEAFKVIAYLNSDEVQLGLARKGYPAVLSNTEVQKQFAADLPELKGKNLPALFKHKQADPYVSPYFQGPIDSLVKTGFNNMIKGSGDINTSLRQMDEEIDKKVAEQKAGGGK